MHGAETFVVGAEVGKVCGTFFFLIFFVPTMLRSRVLGQFQEKARPRASPFGTFTARLENAAIRVPLRQKVQLVQECWQPSSEVPQPTIVKEILNPTPKSLKPTLLNPKPQNPTPLNPALHP